MALSRRSFLGTCASIGPPLLVGARETLSASATVFYGHPGGVTNLVRFHAANVDAPAGRLRVFDARRQLLGTAGMLGVDGDLFGELWLEVARPTRVSAELETPGRRTPLRSTHVLTPPRQWTLHWITVMDPDEVLTMVTRMNPWDRAAALALMRQTFVTGNPYGAGGRPSEGADHVAYLRSSTRAIELERRFGIPSSSIAIAESVDLRFNSAPLALSGAGVRYALLLDDEHFAFHVYEGRDGSRIVTASPPPGGNPTDLRFAAGRDAMAAAVESWLSRSPALTEAVYPLDKALVVSSQVERNRSDMLDTIADWRQRFAYPRLVVGTADEFFASAEHHASTRALFSVTEPMPFRREPPLEHLVTLAVERASAQSSRVENIVGSLTRLLGRDGSQLADFAQSVDFAFAGTLVFNPSSLPRTDLIRMADETERMVTRVPGLGYVFIPNAAPGPDSPYLEPGDLAITGQRFTLRVDPETGAVRSLYERGAAVEWADADRGGINGVTTGRLTDAQRFRLPGIGARLFTERRTTWGRLRTTYTAYEDTPWVDIHNSIENVGETPVRYEFACRPERSRVLWETAAGHEIQAAPTTNFAHLRWVALQGEDRSNLLLRCHEHPFMRVEADGNDGEGDEQSSGTRFRLVSVTAGGDASYRLGATSSSAPADDVWRFGWDTEPFVTTHVTRRGRVSVPHFGQMLNVEPGVVVVGIKPADDDFGIVIYLQEVMGFTRAIRIAPDMMRFGHARLVDLAERDIGESLEVTEDGVRVPMQRFGITALRLAQLGLR